MSNPPTTMTSPSSPATVPADLQPAGLPHVEPTRVEIPALDIDSDLVRLGLHPDGSLEVPSDYALAGWYADGPAPGDADAPPAVIVGHVDSTTGPAIFYRLREVVPGQQVHITRADGSTAVFVVRDVTQYPKSSLPTEEVYAVRDPSEVVLITCSGEFDEVARSYLDNFVVTAQLDVQASSAAS